MSLRLRGVAAVGTMLPFKDGACRVAIETGAPILPMVIAGTRRAMAKGSMRFARARARTIIGEARERLLQEIERS